MLRYCIYIGLSDPITHKQMFSTEEYVNTLKNVCRQYHVPFSFDVIQGGYMYDDGTYVEEVTLRVAMIDQAEETVEEIAEDLSTFFNQDNVMVTQDEVKMWYVKGDKEVQRTVKTVYQERDNV